LERRKEAAALSAESAVAGRKMLENVLSFTSEAERLSFQRTTHPYCLLGTLDNVGPLAETVIRTKGAVLDSLIEDRLLAAATQIERNAILLREADMGVAIVPRSALSVSRLTRAPIKGLELPRTVYLYGVAGRQRSAVASTIMKMLRGTNWAPKLN